MLEVEDEDEDEDEDAPPSPTLFSSLPVRRMLEVRWMLPDLFAATDTSLEDDHSSQACSPRSRYTVRRVRQLNSPPVI